ncbi:MAG TPA: SpoIIE family protein phosphatase [Verrucomicrobiae bacterium]|nr:SpoIIE family protein phosphatase [Verrucomicrobiae bacterium]
MKTTPAFRRLIGTMFGPIALGIALAFAIQGSFQARAEIAATFDRETRIQQAQLTIEELLRLQIDQENSVRGYTITRDPFYAQEYQASAQQFEQKESTVRQALKDQGVDQALAGLDDYDRTQQSWRKNVAQPLLAHPDSVPADLEKRNKAYSDYENSIVDEMRGLVEQKSQQLIRDTLAQFNYTIIGRSAWLVLFALLAMLFNAFSSRARKQLDEERATTAILERAYISRVVPLPNCDVGSAYASADQALAVGGDLFDVYRLSESLALVLIADVSGKGVDAAVLTAFIKFTIRAIALRRREPGAILAEFNTAFAQTVDNPYLFVSMLVGVLDTEALVLRYASAGHDSAFVRRSSGVQQLAVTGPVLGVMEEPFGTQAVHLEPGDTIVLATDGLTEARDRRGKQLREKGAMELIERADPQPQRMCDELVARIRALGRNRMRDDLAIIAIRVREPEAPNA